MTTQWVLRTPQGDILGTYDSRKEAEDMYAAYTLLGIAIGNASGIQGEA